MKKGTKIALILAAILIAAGILALVAGMALLDFDFSKLNSTNYITTEQTISDSFTGISVDCNSSSLRLLPAEDDSCRIVFTDTEEALHTAAVEDGILRISREENRKWFDFLRYIGMLSSSPEIRLYLPEAVYERLTIKTTSGDVELAAGLQFTDAELKCTSGNLICMADVQGSLLAEATSGDIRIGVVSADTVRLKATSGDIQFDGDETCDSLRAETTSGDIRISGLLDSGSLGIETTSGDITVAEAGCQNITITATSGDIVLQHVIAEKEMLLTATSGEVQLTDCDAESIRITTTSGDVEGSLLTGKLFHTETTSGDVIVPHGYRSGFCGVTTTSGDIHIVIAASAE